MIDYEYPEHYADSARSAIRLAEQLQKSGEFDLFRGQRHTFDIQPSALRLGVDIDAAEKRLEEFARWVHNTPELRSLHGNKNAILAVAQHYGLKTPLLDFSRSPRIAGFFATDGGKRGDTGTIICLNKKRFTQSWRDINQGNYDREKRTLTEIIDIDVRNLWRLQAQEGEFLKCHVDRSLLEMFSFFLHIYFPQVPGTQVVDRNDIYPADKSHLETLLDQYFLIESYPDRDKKLQELFKRKIDISEQSVRNEVLLYFKKNELPKDHASWNTQAAKKWLREPDERYAGSGESVGIKLVYPALTTRSDLVGFISKQLKQPPVKRALSKRCPVEWNVIDERGRALYVNEDGSIRKRKGKNTQFSVAEMISSIYSGMRHLPYDDSHITRAITRYLEMMSFDIYHVIEDAVGIEISGAQIRGRGFASKRGIIGALRRDFCQFLAPNKLNSHGKMDFRDILFASRYVRSSYHFEKFLTLFVEDLIPSQAAVAIEDLIVGVNPMRIDVLGES